MDVLLLDSRDSFTWNIAQALGELGVGVDVHAVADCDAATLQRWRPRLVCLGPGPRGPAQSPGLLELTRAACQRFPVFGICLGMQAMTLAWGGQVGRAKAPLHGKRTPIFHTGTSVFSGMKSKVWVMRYHSLVATRVPASFEVLAWDEAQQPMAMRHRTLPFCVGVQFHPESIGTSGGMDLLRAVLLAVGFDVPPVRPRSGHIPPADLDGPRVTLEKGCSDATT